MTDIYQEVEAQIPHLRRYARALTHDVIAADDLVQECLVRALARLHLWQVGTNLRAWLFTILHNQNVNQIRRAVRAGTTVELRNAGSRLHRAATQDTKLELRDLDRALGRLPEEQRAVILMVRLEGMPYGEVAEVLGIPVGTVRSRLSRGRDALRRMMGAEPNESAERAAKSSDEVAHWQHGTVDARSSLVLDAAPFAMRASAMAQASENGDSLASAHLRNR
jgi:RNA polymerase sigma-70 factor (ECF subfamily)